MINDADFLEIALFQNMIRSANQLEDRLQTICYFPIGFEKPYYVLLVNPFNNRYIIYRLDEEVTFQLSGSLLENEQDTSVLFLKYGEQVLKWLRNIKTAYLNIKIENYQI